MPEPQRPFHVLYVDDEPINLRLMRDVFTMVLKRPDQVVTAESAEEALRLLAGRPFDVVIADQRMRGTPGTTLLARVREAWPRIARLILTGYPTDVEVRDALGSGVAEAIVAKPWKPRELEGVIQDLLARPRR